MGWFDRLRGARSLPVEQIPAELDILPLDRLSVHTAEELVALTIDAGDVGRLCGLLERDSPFALRGPEDTVVFLPVSRAQSPAFDPKVGWVVPLTGELTAAILGQLRAQPGGYEIAGGALGFIVE